MGEDTGRTTLEMSFCGVNEVNDHQLSLIARGFPPKLESLTLIFSNCKNVSDTGVTRLMPAIAQLPLQRLHLDFLGCERLTNKSMQTLGDNLLDQALFELN